jgi:hypothetical protein
MQTAFSINPGFNTISNNEGVPERVIESSLQGERLDFMVQRHGKAINEMLTVPDDRCMDTFVKYVGEDAVDFLLDGGAIFAEPRRNMLIRTIEDSVGGYKALSMDAILPGLTHDADHIVFMKMVDRLGLADHVYDQTELNYDRFVSINYMFLNDYLKLPDRKLFGMIRTITSEKASAAYKSRRAITEGSDHESRQFLKGMIDLIGKINPETCVLLCFERYLYDPKGEIDLNATSNLYYKYEKFFKKRGMENVMVSPPGDVVAYRENLKEGI